MWVLEGSNLRLEKSSAFFALERKARSVSERGAEAGRGPSKKTAAGGRGGATIDFMRRLSSQLPGW